MTYFNRTAKYPVTPTITAGIYSDGDVVGGLLTLTLQSGQGSGGGGIIRTLILVDDANQKVALDIFFFDAAPTSFADNAAYLPTAADRRKEIGKVAIAAGDYNTENSIALAEKRNLDIDFAVTNGVIYAYIVTNGSTPTYGTTSDLTMKLINWLN